MNNAPTLRWRKSSHSGGDHGNCVELAALPGAAAAAWRKSSHSGGEHGSCVELAVLPNVAAAAWRKSAHSGGEHGGCVELAAVRDVLAIRDSKHPAGPVLLLSRHELSALLTSVRSGEHDL
ncbi:protein of unknown function [Thermomonospora echinospora]|uniref:DUF397 domain-containing protein n=1 Tax=Thermomonospora echinospora TaxID=1992 RepID=A0A1H5VJ22_9ACTN|nr:DUF397 domain-containing protein [Thermomonospora echinospora]SEF86547.1 protein of unknown function [Thermomonospora echinospora]